MNTDCPICLDPVDKSNILPCNHVAHLHCLQQQFKAECPLCRRGLKMKVYGKPPTSDIAFNIEQFIDEVDDDIDLESEDELEKDDIEDELEEEIKNCFQNEEEKTLFEHEYFHSEEEKIIFEQEIEKDWRLKGYLYKEEDPDYDEENPDGDVVDYD